MGHQVNFFVLPADLAQLQRRIGELAPMALLRDRSTAAQPSEVTGFDASENWEPLLFYYLVRLRGEPSPHRTGYADRAPKLMVFGG